MEQPFKDMMERFLTGSMNADEREQFLAMIRQGQLEEELDQAIDAAMHADRFTSEQTDILKEAVYHTLSGHITGEEGTVLDISKKKRLIGRYWWVAASILMAAGILLYPLLMKKTTNENRSEQLATTEVLPASYGAVLTLGDGSAVLLDSMGNGIVTQQDGVRVRLENNQLIYDQPAKMNSRASAFNIMSTPRGRQFMLVLPDGTKVWMNAASSIRYPAGFDAKERVVQVEGELYFDVAKDAARPFRVMLKDGAALDVLGTSFNINAYDEEDHITATLVDGSVRLFNQSKKSLVLKPLQQAQIKSTDHELRLHNNADIDQVLAWKNGAFDFSNTRLEDMMRQLARWYDIAVEYPQGIPAFEYEGKMSRNITLNGLLKILDQTGLHFRLEGKTLIVLP